MKEYTKAELMKVLINAEYDFDRAKEILDSDEYTVYSSFEECIDIFFKLCMY